MSTACQLPGEISSNSLFTMVWGVASHLGKTKECKYEKDNENPFYHFNYFIWNSNCLG